jgi:hypothetical protein
MAALRLVGVRMVSFAFGRWIHERERSASYFDIHVPMKAPALHWPCTTACWLREVMTGPSEYGESYVSEMQ